MAEEIITSTNAETVTDHEYNASEIQVLKGLEAVRKRLVDGVVHDLIDQMVQWQHSSAG